VEGGLHCLKHNACTGKTPRQKSQWTVNRHLSDRGQKWKPDHAKGTNRGEDKRR
jgi:hypothetical protein